MKVPINKVILIIGGTGAQGLAVVKALLEPTSDGASSPYAVRILTRNPEHPTVKAELDHPKIELVQGSFTDLAKVEHALEGYGVHTSIQTGSPSARRGRHIMASASSSSPSAFPR